jgi:hypothetical protein
MSIILLRIFTPIPLLSIAIFLEEVLAAHGNVPKPPIKPLPDFNIIIVIALLDFTAKEGAKINEGLFS